MARIRSILGDIEGSAGEITFVKTGGANILKQKVGPNSSNSPAQQRQRARFGASGTLARKFRPVINLGFKRVGLQTGYSRFVGFNSDFVTLDVNGIPQIDYGMIEISSGSVTPLAGLAVASAANGQTVSWSDNSDGNGALPNDRVYIAIVKKDTQEVALSLGTGTRSGGSVLVPAPYLAGLAAGDMAIYAFAKRATGTDVSNTSRLANGTGSTGGGVAYTRSVSGPSNTVAGTTITSAGAETFEFNELSTGSSGPYNMVISVAGAQVASIDTFDRYAGTTFRFTDANGVVRTGTVAPAVNF